MSWPMVCNFPTRSQGTGRKIAYHRISLRRIQGKGKQLLSLPLCEAQEKNNTTKVTMVPRRGTIRVP